MLIRLQGALVGEIATVPEAGLRVGSGRDADFQIEDEDVGRFHASIQFESGAGFVLYDLESGGGTRVDGVRVLRWILQDGDVIRIGAECALRFSWVDAEQEALLRRGGARRKSALPPRKGSPGRY